MRYILISFALAACSPYSPELGNEPFLCGSAAPLCPDGYACKMDTTSGKMICESQSGGGNTDGSVGSFQCADDLAVEGTNHNDTVATAYGTPVTLGGRKSVSYAGLAICPSTDKDYYRIDLSGTQNIEAIVTYDDPSKAGAGPLKMSIHNMSDAQLVNATLVTGMTNAIRAYAPNLPMASSPYYIVVQGDGTNENNYKLDINVTP